MSNNYNNTDLLKSLDLLDISGEFKTNLYPGTNSCIKEVKKNGITTKYIYLKNYTQTVDHCPHCGCVDKFESKGYRTIYLRHVSFNNSKTVLEVQYRRFKCHHCNKYINTAIPFQFKDMHITNIAVQRILVYFKENTAMSVISRNLGIGRSTVYRLFNKHLQYPTRYYRLAPIISIDEFRATSDKGTFALNIANPITGKTLDIIEDRKQNQMIKYFLSCPFSERKKVKIIIMDLSNTFRHTMKRLFPHAHIIADKFHYTRLVKNDLVQARIHNCKTIKDDSLKKLIKRYLRLFNQYQTRLNDTKEYYVPYFKNYYTNKQLVKEIICLPQCEELYQAYKIYQKFLTIINEPHNDFKKELNDWIDHIFETNNTHFIATVKNFRSNWFQPILKSLTFKAALIRKGKRIITGFNNGFIESMNNKIKLVKRNAYGYKYFYNLRKRILLHLGFRYTFI